MTHSITTPASHTKPFNEQASLQATSRLSKDDIAKWLLETDPDWCVTWLEDHGHHDKIIYDVVNTFEDIFYPIFVREFDVKEYDLLPADLKCLL